MGARLGIERAVFEGRAIERALFWGRCTGGAVILVLGPIVTPAAPELLIRALGLYFFAYATLMLWVTSRATSAVARERAAWLAYLFDTVGFLSALVLNATDPQWLAVGAAPLYVLAAVARMGLVGGVTALVALAATHVALALWRQSSLGIELDVARNLVSICVYAIAALLATAIDSELRRLRGQRELQVAVHEPLLQAHDALGEGVLITEGERVVYASDGFLELTGRSRSEIMALSSVYELISLDQRASARELTRALPTRGGILRKELLRPDGSRIGVEVALRRYRTDGRARSVAIVRDVTLRDRVLAELERGQRFESLGALAGGIAHDFNNLLAVILNDAHLALTGTASAAAQRWIEEIKDAAERGASLTRQMLVFAHGARASAAVRIDVRREIGYAERLLRRSLAAGVTLELRLSVGVPDVELEAGQLEQILMNLVVNARDAMPDGGRVSIVADEVQLGALDVPGLAAGRYLRLVVSDDGCGMPADVAARAFEPFFTTKPKGRGTGLGLSTVYGVARRAGGHVAIVSAPGKGTTVTVDLPAAATPAADPAPRATNDARGPGTVASEPLAALVEVA